MKLFKIIAFLIGVLFMVGGACPSNDTTQSNKIEQSEIYQNYSIGESNGNYEVAAFFRIGGSTGTTLALSSPSKILFNGQPMKENLNTGSGTFYSISVPNTTPNGTFEFTDRKGKVYTNKMEFAKVSLLASSIKANGSTPIEIPLSRPVSESPNLKLEITDGTDRNTELIGSIFDASLNATKNAIVVKPVVWEKFKNGNLQVSLDVTDSIPTQQGTNLGGMMSFSFESKPATVALLKSGKTNTVAANAKPKANVNSNIKPAATANTSNVNIPANTTANVANKQVSANTNVSVKQ